MSPRVVRWPLALYPRAWRERYGRELALLTEDLIADGRTRPLRLGFNLVVGATRERCRVIARAQTAVLATSAVMVVVAGIVSGIKDRTLSKGKVMTPYVFTHAVGIIYTLVIVCWYVMELTAYLWSRGKQPNAVRIPQPLYWTIASIGLAGVITWMIVAPRVAPAADMHPAVVSFWIGIGLLVIGVALRGWCFWALGPNYKRGVIVSPDQTLVTRGPYRFMRHPYYASGLLIAIAVGAVFGNWLSLGILAAFVGAIFAWRIRVEERALFSMLGERYRAYATPRKRLVPLVW